MDEKEKNQVQVSETEPTVTAASGKKMSLRSIFLGDFLVGDFLMSDKTQLCMLDYLQPLEYLRLRTYKMTHGIERAHNVDVSSNSYRRTKDATKHSYSVFGKGVRKVL